MGRDPREIRSAIESLRLWREMDAATGAETGCRQCGIVYLCDTKAELAAARPGWRAARPFQVDAACWSPRRDRGGCCPACAGDWAGALYTPSDGRAEPHQAAPAIAEAARKHGAAILTNCAVRGIETQAGRVGGVRDRARRDRLRRRGAGRRRLVAAVLRQPRASTCHSSR